MSLDKAIKYGKERRKPYKGSKQWVKSCRNHGHCSICKGNRIFNFNKRKKNADEEIKEVDNVIN
jgi:hypothetical protein